MTVALINKTLASKKEIFETSIYILTIITQKIFFVYSALLNGEHQNHITISKNICALPHKFLQDHHLAACVYPRQMDCLDNAPIHHATNSCNIVAILFSHIFLPPAFYLCVCKISSLILHTIRLTYEL